MRCFARPGTIALLLFACAGSLQAQAPVQPRYILIVANQTGQAIELDGLPLGDGIAAYAWTKATIRIGGKSWTIAPSPFLCSETGQPMFGSPQVVSMDGILLDVSSSQGGSKRLCAWRFWNYSCVLVKVTAGGIELIQEPARRYCPTYQLAGNDEMLRDLQTLTGATLVP